MTKAILIDPFTKTVTEVDVDFSGGLEPTYKLLGCSIVEPVYLDNGTSDAIFVDEEGLFKNEQEFFGRIVDHVAYGWDEPDYQPLAGKGLVVGVDEEGNTVSPTTTVEEVRDTVKWLSREDLLSYSGHF